MPQQKLRKSAKVILMMRRMGNLRKRNEMVQIFLFAGLLQALNLLNVHTTLNKLKQPASAFFEVVVYTGLKLTSNCWTAGALIFRLLSIPWPLLLVLYSSISCSS
jgi:hypothetical protein